jgi:hypothetical protein
MSRDEEDLRSANRRFYQALQSGDESAMRAVWSAEGMVSCVHPGSVLIAGWDDVMESWSILLEDIAQWSIAVEERWMEVRGDLGWVLSVERYEAPEEGEEEEGEGDEDEEDDEVDEEVVARAEPGSAPPEAEEEGAKEAAEGGGAVREPVIPVEDVSEAVAAAMERERAEAEREATEAEAERGLLDEESGGGEGEPESSPDAEVAGEEEEEEEEDEDEGLRLVMTTHVFHREQGEWKLVHRHASPASPSDDAPALARQGGPAN